MRLARRKSQEPETLLVGVVEQSLPADPGLENAFLDIYLRIHDEAMDHAERFLEYEAADDAVHEAVADIWERWRKLLPEQRTDAYFYGAIHNQVLKRLKRDKRFVELEDAEHQLSRLAIEAIDAAPVPGAQADEHDAADVVDRIVGDMPPRRKAVFLLLREKEMTYKEVAETLGISVPSVNTHLTLAKEALRVGLRRAGFSIPAPTPMKRLRPKNPEVSND
jgi:RNA polymerase sigma-70 factor (ECF subfamily)